MPLITSRSRNALGAACALLPLFFLSAWWVPSQTTRATVLAPPNARLAEDLVEVHTGRELADGRLLIGEGTLGSRRLLVVDFQRGTAQQIGSRGHGPGEYQIVSSLFPLASDSTLLLAEMGRWLVLSGTRIVRTVNGNDPAMRLAMTPSGADSIGNLLSSERRALAPDSSGRIFVSRKTGIATPAARLRSSTEAGYPPPATRRAGGRVDFSNGPWESYELAQLFPDGWLAVARVQPYRVDWRTPEGRWILGKPLPSPTVRVTRREKAAYMQRSAERTGNAVRSPTVHSKWPTEIPPFLPGSLIGSSDGRLLVLRTPTADRPEVRYDLIDRQGRLERQLLLDRNQRIVAFGKTSVYVVVTDDVDLERIQRHSWPE